MPLLTSPPSFFRPLFLLLFSIAFVASVTTSELAHAAEDATNKNAKTHKNDALTWQEGKHYQVLNHHHSNPRVGVVQLFSYWCLNCYRYEKMTQTLQEKLPTHTPFTKVHVDYLPKPSKNLQQLGTKYMLIARAIKKENAFNNAMFSAIHNQRKVFTNEQEIKDLLSAQGVNTGKITKLADYSGMQSRINYNNKLIQGKSPVPAFIVNGKYKTEVSRKLSQQDLVELILWLTQQP